MITVYGIKNCDTIKKARRSLRLTVLTTAFTITAQTESMPRY